VRKNGGRQSIVAAAAGQQGPRSFFAAVVAATGSRHAGYVPKNPRPPAASRSFTSIGQQCLQPFGNQAVSANTAFLSQRVRAFQQTRVDTQRHNLDSIGGAFSAAAPFANGGPPGFLLGGGHVAEGVSHEFAVEFTGRFGQLRLRHRAAKGSGVFFATPFLLFSFRFLLRRPHHSGREMNRQRFLQERIG
jgi:hypothetical protein